MPEVMKMTPAPGVCPVAEPEQLCLFDGDGVDVTALRMERAAMAERRRAPSTLRAYACAWRDFVAWCRAASRCPLPATADTVSLYAVHLARLGRLPATINQRVAGVVAQHRAAGFVSPAPAGGDVREVLAGITRKLGSAPRHAKAAVTPEELRAMVAGIDGRGRRGPYSWALSGGAARVARDRAILLFGFASGLRRSELAALELADVEVVERGAVVVLRRSKTDQSGAGRELGVHRGRRRSTCPVRALLAWLGERGDWPGPLFCRVSAAGSIARRGLKGEAVAAVVQGAAARAGLDAAKYGGHSLRAGCATAAADAGASDRAIMGRTGHRTSAMVGRYIRHGSLFAVDPLAGVL